MENKAIKINSFELSSEISIINFIILFIVTIILAQIITVVYNRYGVAISNRNKFSRIFILLAVTVMVVITIIKSSLALSLGLVGALSIVRFRTAIKEPEELIFAFICIAIGLGMGANQPYVTICAVLLICTILILKNKIENKSNDEFINLRIVGPIKLVNINNMNEILIKNTIAVELKKLDEMENTRELLYGVVVSNVDSLNNLIDEIKKYSDSINISYYGNIESE